MFRNILNIKHILSFFLAFLVSMIKISCPVRKFSWRLTPQDLSDAQRHGGRVMLLCRCQPLARQLIGS